MKAQARFLSYCGLSILIVGVTPALISACCGGDESAEGSVTVLQRPGGVCGEVSADQCLNSAFGMYKIDRDAAHIITEQICAGNYGKATREACTLSGHTFREGGFEVQQNHQKAIERYERGCPLNDANAQAGSCFRIGIINGTGSLTLGQPPTHPINIEKGRQYLSLACSKGMSEACTVLQTL